MKRWMKWTLFAALAALPGFAWAGGQLVHRSSCPIPGCHCR